MSNTVSEYLFRRTADISATGSIRDMHSRREAAQLIKDGFPVGAFVGGVCVIWIDGAHPEAAETVYSIKGERRVGRPFGTVLHAAAFVAMLDMDKIPTSLRQIFLDANTLASRLGDLCLIRAPITNDAADKLPAAMVSKTPDGTCWLQNWVPFEHAAVCQLGAELRKQGVTLSAVTSMNISGRPELVDQQTGIAFCRTHRIPLFLMDPCDAADFPTPHVRLFSFDIMLRHEHELPDQND